MSTYKTYHSFIYVYFNTSFEVRFLFRPTAEIKFQGVLTMVFNTQNYWGFGLCPASGILETTNHNVSETGFVSEECRLLGCGAV
jgi:hypothetical protein